MDNSPTRIVFACDESGYKGYANRNEEFPGQVGVFAGIMVPDEHLESIIHPFEAIVIKYTREDGKLHITDLSPDEQKELRYDVYDAIRSSRVPCFWHAIHVAGFHRAYTNEKALMNKVHSERDSYIKLSGGGRSLQPTMHITLFMGLYARLIAFCKEREKTNLEIEVRIDSVDSPIVKNFREVANKLLDFSSQIRKGTGYNPYTGNVVEGTIKIKIMNPEDLAIITKVNKLELKVASENDGLVLAADVLANSLTHLFHTRSDEERYRALSCPQAIIKHPLAQCLNSFLNWGEYSFSDTYYRHPKDPDHL